VLTMRKTGTMMAPNLVNMREENNVI
jgi:hypothetical protein